MTHFFLVRHGQASFGCDDYDRLSPLGHRQSRWLGEYYRGRGTQFDGLIAGTLVRHMETTRSLLDGLQADIPLDPRPGLNEFPSGAIVEAYLKLHPLERLKKSDSRALHYKVLRLAFQQWQAGNLGYGLPERWQEFDARVVGTMAYLQTKYSHCKNVLVVSSGGVIAVWIHHILCTAVHAVIEINLQVRNSSVTDGFFNTKVYRLSTFNRVPHLDRAERLSSITYS